MRDTHAHTIWMITAVLFVNDAHFKTIVSRSDQSDTQTALPIPAIATSELDLGALDNEAKVSFLSRETSAANLEAEMSGKRVFAVQYWRCEHRPVDRIFDQWREQLALRGRGIQKVSTGHRGLGNSDDEDDEDDDTDNDDWDADLEFCSEDLPGDKNQIINDYSL
jgi:hypothetical protein